MIPLPGLLLHDSSETPPACLLLHGSFSGTPSAEFLLHDASSMIPSRWFKFLLFGLLLIGHLLYGSWEGLVGCKMLVYSLGKITPGKPYCARH